MSRSWLWHGALAALVGVAVSLACAPPPPLRPPSQSSALPRLGVATELALGERIQALLAREGVRGASVALVERGTVLYEAGFGQAHESDNVDVTPSTTFHLGDASSLLLATVALRLSDAGKLRFDEPLDALLPVPVEKSAAGRHASVSEVLSHHSGLPPGPLAHFSDEVRPRDYEAAWTDLLDLEHEAYAFSPGEIYAPSTMGLRLLAAGFATRERRSYGHLLVREVLVPFGMLDSALFGVDPKGAHYAVPFAGKEAKYYRDIPALGVLSSARDMARWLAVVLGDGTLGGRSVVSEASLRALFRVQNEQVKLDDGYPVRLGLVPVGTRRDGGLAVGAESYLSPHGCLIWIVPEERRGVVVFATQRDKRDALIDVAEESLALLAAREAEPHAASTGPAVPVEEALPLAEREPFVGVYATPVGPITLRTTDTGFELSHDRGTFTLTHWSDDNYRLHYKLLGLMPISVAALEPFRLRFRIIEGAPYLYVYRRGVLYGTLARLEPRPLDAIWGARVGRYEVVTPDQAAIFSRLELEYDTEISQLTLRATLAKGGLALRYAIEPRDDRAGVFAGKGHLMGGGLSFEPGPDGVDRLRFSGFLARRVR